MSVEVPVPQLPVYDKPPEKVTAVLPKGLQLTKMPSTMNKMISKMLLPKMKTLPKMKAKLPKMKSRPNVRSKARLPKNKKGIQIA